MQTALGETYIKGLMDRSSTLLASTIHFHVRGKINRNPDMVRFALLCRGLFFCAFAVYGVKRLGGRVKLLEKRDKKWDDNLVLG